MRETRRGFLQLQLTAMARLGFLLGRVLACGWAMDWLEGLGKMDLAGWDETWAATSLPCTRRGGPSAGGNQQEKGKEKEKINATEEELRIKSQPDDIPLLKGAKRR